MPSCEIMKTNRAQEILEKLVGVFESGELVNIIAKRPVFNSDNQSEKPSDKWSISNQIIQIISGTDDARGYKQWQKVGRQVQKGAKAIYIIAPMTRKRRKVNKETGEEEENCYISGFRYIPVFRYEDTEGAPLAGTQELIPETLPPLFELAEKIGVKVLYKSGKIGKHRGALGTFHPIEKEIHLFTKDEGVFFHELAHAAHATFRCLFTETTKKERETVAEIVAAVLSVKYGQGINSGIVSRSWRYIQRFNDNQPEKAIRAINRLLNDIKKVLEILLLEENEEKDVQKIA